MRWQYTESYACCVVLISRAHSDERIYSEFRFCHFQSNTLGVTHTTDRNINTFLAPFNRLRKCIGSVNHIAADTIFCSFDWREETLFFESESFGQLFEIPSNELGAGAVLCRWATI